LESQCGSVLNRNSYQRELAFAIAEYKQPFIDESSPEQRAAGWDEVLSKVGDKYRQWWDYVSTS
jgi:hypothetical protein